MEYEIDGVSCYGRLRDDSNLDAVYDDEMDDYVCMTRDPLELPTWTEVVKYLKSTGVSDLVEVSAI